MRFFIILIVVVIFSSCDALKDATPGNSIGIVVSASTSSTFVVVNVRGKYIKAQRFAEDTFRGQDTVVVSRGGFGTMWPVVLPYQGPAISLENPAEQAEQK